MALDIARGLPLARLCYYDAIGDAHRLASLVEQAEAASTDDRLCVRDGFTMALILTFRSLTGRMSLRDRLRWHRWNKGNRAGMKDLMRAWDDPWVWPVHMVSEVKSGMRQPVQPRKDPVGRGGPGECIRIEYRSPSWVPARMACRLRRICRRPTSPSGFSGCPWPSGRPSRRRGRSRYLQSFCFGTNIDVPEPGYGFSEWSEARGLESFEPLFDTAVCRLWPLGSATMRHESLERQECNGRPSGGLRLHLTLADGETLLARQRSSAGNGLAQRVRLPAQALRDTALCHLHPHGQCHWLHRFRGSIGCRHRRRAISA